MSRKKGLGLNAEQEARLAQIQTRRQRLPRRSGVTPRYASVGDVEEFVRLVCDTARTAYIFEMSDGQYEWTVWSPDEMAHAGTLVKTVHIEPEPRRGWTA